MTAAAAAILFAACSGPAGPTSAAHRSPAGGSGTAQPATGPSGRPGSVEEVLGLNTMGALVVIDPSRGTQIATLAAGVASGEEVSATADGSTVYYEQQYGCYGRIYSMPASGGSSTLVTTGALPAVSPDGTELAYVREPRGEATCAQRFSPSQYMVVVRNLKTGAETTYPASPQLVQTGLSYPISYLSWAADGRRLAVSVDAPEDNAGWALVVVDTRTSRYYRSEVPGDAVPVTGNPDPAKSYYRQGVFMPNGDLFVNRVCCIGMGPGPRRASSLLWEVSASGGFVKQVAIGFTDRDHTSLAADRTGQELLYLAGTDLYVSDGGQRPRAVTGGLLAATWIVRPS